MKIVFPEGLDERVLTAAGRLAADGVLTPIIVGNIEQVEAKAKELNVSLDNAEIYDPANYAEFDALVASFVERRKGKATEEDARKILLDENYFGTMLVYTNKSRSSAMAAALSLRARAVGWAQRWREYLRRRAGALSLMGRDTRPLASVAQACGPTAASVQCFTCDVTDAEMMEEALTSLDARRPIDTLIANAGMGGSDVLAPSSGEPLALARTITNVNMLGVLNTAASLAERFCARSCGHIVIVSSLAGMQGLADPGLFGLKAAARVYGEGLRRPLAPRTSASPVLVPGFIATPMSRSCPFAALSSGLPSAPPPGCDGALHVNEAEVGAPMANSDRQFAMILMPFIYADRGADLGRRWTRPTIAGPPTSSSARSRAQMRIRRSVAAPTPSSRAIRTGATAPIAGARADRCQPQPPFLHFGRGFVSSLPSATEAAIGRISADQSSPS